MKSEPKAKRAVNFFEKVLTHTKGQWRGKPFKLVEWERKATEDIFGTLKRDGTRRYSTAYIEIPKKNGKTTWAAGVAAYGLFMDQEPGAEIYSAAATRDQASVVFREVAQMLRQSPILLSKVEILDSTKTIYLKHDRTTFYKAISADAGLNDGVNPHVVVFDEIHRQKSRELWDILVYGMATRLQPLMLGITTAGVEAESPICWELHEHTRQVNDKSLRDPSFYGVIYSLGEKENWRVVGKPATGKKKATGWFKANPGLGVYKRLDMMKEFYRKAKLTPGNENAFRRFQLNQWLSQLTRWLPMDKWDAGRKPFSFSDLSDRRCYAGLDLSTNIDITALCLTFPVDDQVFLVPHFWMPESQVDTLSTRDRVPYDAWVRQGLIHLTPGNVIDYDFIRKTINELGDDYNIQEICFDPWNATQLSTQLDGDGFEMIPLRQGFSSMSPPTKAFERLVLSGKLRHNNNPVLRWMADCVSVKRDPADNMKPVKPDRAKSSKRIDGVVAAILGVDRIVRHEASVYEERGIITA